MCACPACRLQFLFPQPEDSVLANIYSEAYFLANDTAEAAARRARMKRATGELYIRALAGLIPSARLLEIGCGHGEVLAVARERGFRVAGVEISKHAAAMANQSLGAPLVRLGNLEEANLPPASFDAVLAADVIEHVRRPDDLLGLIYDLLAPNGVLMLVTPSLDSWPRRLLREHWLEYKVEHLYHFSPRSIRLLLEDSGFRDIRISPSYKILSWDYICRHFDRFRVPFWSPVVGAVRRFMPAGLAHRQFRIRAGGLMASARKPGS